MKESKYENSKMYLVQEYADKGDLAGFIKKQTKSESGDSSKDKKLDT